MYIYKWFSQLFIVYQSYPFKIEVKNILYRVDKL